METEKMPNDAMPWLDAKGIRSLFIAVCMLVPIAWTGLVNGVVQAVVQPEPVPPIVSESEWGAVKVPVSGSFVGSSFQVKGQTLPAPVGHQYWIVTEKDGLLWPKVGLGRKGGGFDREFSEGAKKYYLRILRVDRAGQIEFTDWLKTARATGKWPGIREPENSTEVARIKLHHSNK